MIRVAFLEAASAARSLLASPAVAESWERPSALEAMTVGALCGHLTRSVTTPVGYLNDPPPLTLAGLLDAPGYILSIEGLSSKDGPDLASDLHVSIRERADGEATSGPEGLLMRWDRAVKELASRLATEPPTRALAVLGGRPMLVDDYLVTRLIEMVVHADDLAMSIVSEPPDDEPPDTTEFSPDAWHLVLECLMEVAVRRHGPLAAMRAMTRTERDHPNAMRVL